MELCLKIERIVRTFLYGGHVGDHKVSIVGWDDVTKKKEHDGLGFRRMHEMNLVFLAKLGWRLITEKTSLWARVLVAIYEN